MRARMLRGAQWLGLSAALSVAGAHALVTSGTLVDSSRFLPHGDALTVTDRHNTPLRHARSDGMLRRWTSLQAFPMHVRNAFLAAEDKRFFEHNGYDPTAILRAATRNLLPSTQRSGASTITQQLVKMEYGRAGNVASKLLEALRAATLERQLSKEQLLELYLNRVPFGDRIQGVTIAAEEYFGVTPSELSIAQAALLAAIPRAPSATEPRRHPQQALARRATVLQRMFASGWITRAQLDTALAEPLALRDASARPWHAPHFVEYVLQERARGAIPLTPHSVQTSLDLPLQLQTEEVLRTTLPRFHSRGARNAAAIVVENETGEILAYVGAAAQGNDDDGGSLDLLRARRQPGSALKTFAYELFFERGGTPATLLDDVAVTMRGGHGTEFIARDYDGTERGPVRARVALSSSLNLAALDVARRVGPDPLLRRFRNLGLAPRELERDPGVAVVLGGLDVSATQIANAYVTLARGGTQISLRPVLGTASPGRSVMDTRAAAVTRDVLIDAQAREQGFGRSLIELAPGVTFGLKTGTSQGWRDAWAATFSERVTVVVWFGDPAGAPMTQVSGFEAAAPTAVRILSLADHRTRAISTTPNTHAWRENPLEEALVCGFSGLAPGPRCQHLVREHFAPGTAPLERCHMHDEQNNNVLPARYQPWMERQRAGGYVVRDPETNAAPSVLSPRDGAVLLVDPSRGETAVQLRAAVRGAEIREAQFEVDGQRISGNRQVLSPGEHTVTVEWRGQRSVPSRFRVVRP